MAMMKRYDEHFVLMYRVFLRGGGGRWSERVEKNTSGKKSTPPF